MEAFKLRHTLASCGIACPFAAAGWLLPLELRGEVIKIMKTFKEFPQNGVKCIVCDTNDNKSCVLVATTGTAKEGYTAQFIPIHIDCIDLLYDSDLKLLVQILPKGGDKSEQDDKRL